MSHVDGLEARERLAGRYEIVALVGAGAMGRVYKAIDHELEETVAVKVLAGPALQPDDAHARDRFRREVKLARRIAHENVARVFDIGEHGSMRFLTMEFIDGESVGDVVARRGALPVEQVVSIGRSICAGLAAAHAAGVVHRDLKPDNVLLSREGRVVITDFGIARSALVEGGIGQTIGHVVGTPAYMAPEQIEAAKEVGPPADVYALGAMLFELTTGARPFQGATALAVAAARLTQSPPDPRTKAPAIPAALAELTLRCMERSPAARPPIDDLAAQLAEIAATLPDANLGRRVVVTTPPRSGARSRPPSATASAATALAPRSIGLAAPEVHDRTLAVLPLRNMGPPEDADLADGLTEEIVDHLSMVRGIRVRSALSTDRYRNARIDPRDAGHELGVQVVAHATVQRSGDLVRISARLVGVEDGFQLWAKRFERPAREMLRIGDEVAANIAEALGAERPRIPGTALTDPATVELYLRARAAARGGFVPGAPDAALPLFEQALALAPDNPTILSGYAMARARHWYTSKEGRAEAIEIAERAANAAPTLGEARLARAHVLLLDGNPVGAIAEAKRAVTLAPGMPEAHSLVGRMLTEAAFLPEGMRRLELVLRIDPQLKLAVVDLARALALTGDWEGARAQVEALTALDPITAHIARARWLLWRPDPAEADDVLRMIAGEDEPPPIRMVRAIAKLVRDGGDPSVAGILPPDAADADASESVRRSAFFAQLRAELYAYLGRKDDALVAMGRAVKAGLFDLLWLERCPVLQALHGERAFTEHRAVVAGRARAIVDAFIRT